MKKTAKRAEPSSVDDLIGARLKVALEERDFSYESFARSLRLQHLGKWTKASVYDVRSGRRRLRLSELIAFARVLKKPVYFFLDADAEGVTKVELEGGKSIEPQELLGMFRALEMKSGQWEIWMARNYLDEARDDLMAAFAGIVRAAAELSSLQDYTKVGFAAPIPEGPMKIDLADAAAAEILARWEEVS